MAEVDAGAVAPGVVTPPAADAVPAPGAPNDQGNASQQQADDSVKSSKTYTEEEHRKGISERLTKERRRLERTLRAELERDYLKQELASRDSPRQPQQQAKGKPKPSDFEGQPYENYVEAVAEWIADGKAEAKFSKLREESQQQRQDRDRQEQSREAAKRLMQGAEKYHDFKEVVGAEDVPFTPPMADAITRVKNAADVAYHLATHREEAERIASLSVPEQIWEIKDVSARLSAPPKSTSAPPPIVPNSSQSKVSKDYKDMTTAEHIEAWRNRKQR